MTLSKTTSKATRARVSTRRKSKSVEKQRPKVDWFPEELKAFKPPERYTVSEWADNFRVLTSVSAEPGRWRTNRTPYLKEPMDRFTDPLIEKIVLCFGAQLGKTETELNMIGYALDQTSSPTMMVYPTDTIAKFASDKRVQPMIKSVKSINDKFYENSKLLELDFNNGNYMVLVGANSPSSLSSRSIKYLFFDEIDKYPAFAGKEADPIKLATERTKTFVDKKIVMVSTPTVESGNIWQAFMSANERRQYYVPCPHCGVSQVLKFKQIKWPEEHNDNADMIRDTAYYECEHCGERIYDKHKMEMLRSGEWRAVNESQSKVRSVSYHLSSIYSPWVTFGDVAYEFKNSKGTPATLMNFINSWLAEPWKSSKTKSTQNLEFTQSNYPCGVVPDKAVLLIASVDVQLDHFWWEVRAYAPGVKSYLIDYGQASTWGDLEEIIINREYPSEYGEARQVMKAGIDSGFRTDEVYQFCSRFPEVCIPIKGSSNHSTMAAPYTMTSLEKGVVGGLKLYVLNTDYWKDFIFARMIRPADEDGTIHLYKECPQEYSDHLRSEEKQEIRNVKTGAVTVQWKPLTSHPVNHLLDTCTYNAAVADIAGVKYLVEPADYEETEEVETYEDYGGGIGNTGHWFR
ncbi:MULTISPECIES: terminase gpA endonuclease subunit [Veillonella]|uniref:terminase gpA endonuclease subunit n=1 Tax=Veillonella TaxID=29465 RepID=UPI00020F0842|nr:MULTISPECIES: terminase gpA endonuclease subunit [Veillonella]EGL77567.1 phage terminase large subunit (GpA) [Veillonella parvula ACS-068-V-Sch12]MDU3474884.1 terminase gpA endonuclease subunit [Veillonella sp.]MDU3481460.1 terminase gpA endonuclease subunit [Veillonella sp.]